LAHALLCELVAIVSEMKHAAHDVADGPVQGLLGRVTAYLYDFNIVST
jgi:hypothetical protein